MERLEERLLPEFNLSLEEIAILKSANAWAFRFFEEAQKDERIVMGGHGFDHNQRVSGVAAVIAAYEGYEPFLPVLTALLFDVGRTSVDPRAHTSQHGELSREMTNDFVNTLPLSQEDKLLVLNAIEDHPKLNDQISEERKTYLLKILMDADRLDSLGALGPVRAAATRWRLPMFSDAIHKTIEDDQNITTIFQDFAFRVPKMLESMWTSTGRAIAVSRMPYLQIFTQEYEKEAKFMHNAFRKIMEEESVT